MLQGVAVVVGSIDGYRDLDQSGRNDAMEILGTGYDQVTVVKLHQMFTQWPMMLALLAA